MFSDTLPTRRHRDSMIQKPIAEISEFGLDDSVSTVETLVQSSIDSSWRHLQRQDSALSDCSLSSEGEEIVEKRMRRITISCLQDLEVSPLAAPQQRITTKRASDIHVREQRVSESMTSNFHVSMHTVGLDWFQSEESQTITSSSPSPVSPRVSSNHQEEGSKRVAFSKIEIREYGIIPGDNPGGVAGAPLTMEWDSYSCITIDMERYEDIRQPHRRRHSELIIPASHRADTLFGLGFTRENIRNAAKKAYIGRQQRRSTLASLRHYQVHEKMERAKRFALNLVTLGFRSQVKKSYLKKHCPEHYQ